MRKVGVGLFVVAVVATILAACGGGGAATPPSTINVSLSTYALKPSSNVAKAGDVTFKIKNEASDLVHEFVVVKTDTAADKLAMASDGQKADEDKVTAVDEVEDIQPGTNGELKVNLAPGHYVLMCNIEGHYMQGMHADLTVQ